MAERFVGFCVTWKSPPESLSPRVLFQDVVSFCPLFLLYVFSYYVKHLPLSDTSVMFWQWLPLDTSHVHENTFWINCVGELLEIKQAERILVTVKINLERCVLNDKQSPADVLPYLWVWPQNLTVLDSISLGADQESEQHSQVTQQWPCKNIQWLETTSGLGFQREAIQQTICSTPCLCCV